MEQTVYADLLFMINFSMDLLCMFFVARLLTRRFSLLRATFASAMGGLYAVASLFSPLENTIGTLIDVLFCLIMCVITFANRHERPTSLLLISAAYFLSSMLLGGIMTAIFNLMNQASPPLDALSESGDMPLWLFALVAAASSAVTWIGGRFLRTRAQVTSAEVEIRLGKRKTVVRAMCDSGNLLRDTVSGKPVIVSDLRSAVNLLPVDCPAIAEWNTETVAELPLSVASRVRMIPMGTAATEGILFALRPDSITIRTGNQIKNADALVGFADIRCASGEYAAIIPPELIT